MASKKRGARLKLNRDRIKLITDEIARGVPKCHACHLAGVSESSLYSWIAKAEEGSNDPSIFKDDEEKSVFMEFLEGIKKAEAEFIQRNMLQIQIAGQNGNWQANAWTLERLYPKLFGRKDRHEHTGDNGGPIKHTITPEDVKQYEKELEEMDI